MCRRAGDRHRRSTRVPIGTDRCHGRLLVGHLRRKLNGRVRVLFDRRYAHVFRLLTRLQVDVVLLADFSLAGDFDQGRLETVERLNEMVRGFC